MSLYEKGSELIRKGQEIIKEGRDFAIRKSEQALKIERIKTEIRNLKKDKDDKLKELSRKVYERYTQNSLTDPDLLAICQDVKAIQWQVDEKWTEINNLKTKK